MLLLSIRRFPDLGLKNPFNKLAIVVLPLPEDPTRATLSPLLIVKLILSKIFASP